MAVRMAFCFLVDAVHVTNIVLKCLISTTNYAQNAISQPNEVAPKACRKCYLAAKLDEYRAFG